MIEIRLLQPPVATWTQRFAKDLYETFMSGQHFITGHINVDRNIK